MPGAARDERGSVTLVTVAVLGLALVLVLMTADLARVLAASARAQTAADSAALAAAQDLALASEDPTSVAAAFASANGAVLESCDCPPGSPVAEVVVAVDPGDLLMLSSVEVVRARARAEVSP